MKINSILAIGVVMALSLVSFKPSDKEVQSEKRFGGLALYTVRDAMKDARATLEKVAQAGYVNVESAGYNNGKFYNLSPADFKSLLDEMKLTPISAHQGKFIASRSEQSILKEVEELTKHPEFKGYLSDIGGPSANMYKMKGKDEAICAKCVSPSCIHPVICHNLDTSHKQMTDLYRKIDKFPGVKKA